MEANVINSTCTYRSNEIKAALRAAGVKPGAACLVHAALFALGWPQDSANVAQTWLEQLREVLGPGGTLILPAFTYSYCRHQVFDPLTSKSKVSLLANYALKHHLGYRTLDPNFSYIIIHGSAAHAHQVASYRFSNVSFDLEPSIIALAQELSAEALLVSVRDDKTVSPFTCVHYVEQELGRPCRFMKRFVGQTKLAGQLQTTDSYFYCRLQVPNSGFDWATYHPASTTRLGAGGIYCCNLCAYLAQVRHNIKEDPWWGLQGPALSRAQCQELLAQEQEVCAPHEIVRTYQPPIKL